jgi:6-phosphogluconolactonase/glucosamine-6-phosphate isomerase/deaminase
LKSVSALVASRVGIPIKPHQNPLLYMYEFDISPKIFSSSTIDLYKPKVIQFTSNEMMYSKFATWLLDKAIEISAEYGTARLGLSTGSVLKESYKILSKMDSFPPENIEIYSTDEVHGSGSHKKEIISSITQKKLTEIRYYNFFDTSKDKPKAVESYSEILDQFDDGEGFDICVLQVGKNGQIAGLVQNGNGLNGSDENVVSNGNLLSVSMSMILKSKYIALVIQDENDTLEEILEGTKHAKDFPAKILLAHPDVHIFYHLDV